MGGITAPEMVYVERLDPMLEVLPEQVLLLAPCGIWKDIQQLHSRVSPLCSRESYMENDELQGDIKSYILLTAIEELDEELAKCLRQDDQAVLVFSFGANYQLYQEAYRKMKQLQLEHQTLLRVSEECRNAEEWSLKIASHVGGFFLDRLSGGLWITAPHQTDPFIAVELCRNILQSAGVRRYKTEFISCPGCGRTLFDLQTAVSKVKKAFGHLNSLKIAVMGCVVNGPGEMGDADFGYVGAGNGKVNLYQGRQMVRAAIPEEDAIEALRLLIESTLDKSSK